MSASFAALPTSLDRIEGFPLLSFRCGGHSSPQLLCAMRSIRPFGPPPSLVFPPPPRKSPVGQLVGGTRAIAQLSLPNVPSPVFSEFSVSVWRHNYFPTCPQGRGKTLLRLRCRRRCRAFCPFFSFFFSPLNGDKCRPFRFFHIHRPPRAPFP